MLFLYQLIQRCAFPLECVRVAGFSPSVEPCAPGVDAPGRGEPFCECVAGLDLLVLIPRP